MEQDLIDIMSKIGVTENGAKVYLKLSETGPTTIANLTRKTGIARTTVRINLEKLIEKGLVTHVVKESKKLLTAESIDKVQLILDQQKYVLESKKKTIKKVEEVLPSLVDFMGEIAGGNRVNGSEDVVKVYEGRDSVYSLYQAILGSSKVYSFSNLDAYHLVYPETLSFWKDAFVSNPNREHWDIVIDTPFAREVGNNSHDRYSIKFLPNTNSNLEVNTNNFSDYILFDDSLAIIQLLESYPMGTVIKSSQITSSFRVLHKLIWGVI